MASLPNIAVSGQPRQQDSFASGISLSVSLRGKRSGILVKTITFTRLLTFVFYRVHPIDAFGYKSPRSRPSITLRYKNDFVFLFCPFVIEVKRDDVKGCSAKLAGLPASHFHNWTIEIL